MIHRMHFLTQIAIALLLAVPAFAQTSATRSQNTTAPPTTTADEDAVMELMASAGPLLGIVAPPVLGHPYSAQQVVERSQNLPDGTHIDQKDQGAMLYRDSEGRTRFDEMGNTDLPNLIEITDPVDGYQYSLNPNTHVARRTPFKTQTLDDLKAKTAANAIPPAAASSRPKPQTSTESLGTQFIEGVAAEGTRTTTVYPEGSMGNDKPIASVYESWRSSDLQVEVLLKISNPRIGDTTMSLEKIVLAEPDPSLFLVPAAYKIVDAPTRVPQSAPIQ
jgi:hypothetical protein